MATAWRLSPPAFARALDGEGNRVFGARWNSPGHGVVYASENLSLCVLEPLLPPMEDIFLRVVREARA